MDQGPLAVTDPVHPDLGPNTYVFDPTMPAERIQAVLDEVFARQETAQFGPGRAALLFKPGRYAVDANIGFFTSIAGLGLSPDDTLIEGHVRVEADWFDGNATHNFWRGAENLAVDPSGGWDRWAVSQAAPYRRMHLRGGVRLWDGKDGWASGGFFADTVVDGPVLSGTQQQWLSRNCEFGQWTGANWNMVFVGVAGAPAPSFPDPPHTVVERTPLVREKPFLHVDADGAFAVFVPDVRTDSTGASWTDGPTPGRSLPLTQFFVITPGTTAATIGVALAQGRDLLFTPGVYDVDTTIEVTRPGTVVLGIGLPTLVPVGGIVALRLADADGIIVAGLMFDAAPEQSPLLMEVGPPGSGRGHAADPISLHDVFFRVGGTGPGRAETCLAINSSDVICDHTWIWRADHGEGCGWDVNTAATGLVVDGADVTCYGLFVEHFQRTEVLWRGERGRTYFFQNEKPYDPPNQESWLDGDVRGFPAYRVADDVTEHEAWGLGSYCFFQADPSVVNERSFQVPEAPGVQLRNLVIVSLGGVGTIANAVNDRGGPADKTTWVRHLPA
ncbi:coagulation factor 5/8 type domain-containing protein [Catellatospora tritici]|uniref:coagulation factor 5/8 type domain-containing protein n=1 Tax=Catellatospora tritici TaxID=2851566 RepID=UPI001C2DE768|nr:coagulation factor 5/8 type domain-containing protein [Catellatospora tritici]MBV1855048.1 coagulation factor 5/8 type domain-containing protein [Catellatospora tritici]